MTGQELYDSHQPGDCPDVLLWGTDRDGGVWNGEPAMLMICPDCLKAYPMDDTRLPAGLACDDRSYFSDLAAVRVELADHDHLRRRTVPPQGPTE